jgi:hypothetical protein
MDPGENLYGVRVETAFDAAAVMDALDSDALRNTALVKTLRSYMDSPIAKRDVELPKK